MNRDISGFKQNVTLFIWLAVAISLHFLVDIYPAGSRLRVGATDLILPFMIIPVIYEIIKHKHLQRLGRPSVYPWFIAISLWFFVSLYIGYQYIDEWLSWALINKTLGWYVLLGYFSCGAWFVLQKEEIHHYFLKGWFLSGWFICEYTIVEHMLWQYGILDSWQLVRAEGFYSNANAFGCAMVVMLLFQLPYMKMKKLFPSWLHALGAALTLLAIFFSASRSAALGLAFALPLLIWWRLPGLKAFLNVIFALVLICLFGLVSIMTLETMEMRNTVTGTGSNGHNMKHYKMKRIVMMRNASKGGIAHRIVLTKSAITQWQKSPVMGIGLGTFYWRQINDEDELSSVVQDPAVIHTSVLWILTEMGLIGLFLFTGFIVSAFIALWKANNRQPTQPIIQASILILIAMIGISIGTEALYQRYFWLFLGMGLALANVSDKTGNTHDVL